MGRIGAILLLLACLCSTGLSAQVIECPGFLPSSKFDEARMATRARQLLERFIAILDLQDVDAVDEKIILAMHKDQPEQLVIKLSYLALQCQIVVMDSKITREERLKAVRRVFLDYVLKPPNTDIESLADYVNEIAAMDHDSALTPSVTSIEQTLRQAPRRQWQERWFPDDDARASDLGQWSVIVSSPRYEDEGWAELRRHQQSWPDVYFELDSPYDLESPFYAVIAGRALSLDRADALLDTIKAEGMAEDAFRWTAPDRTKREPLPRNASAPKIRPFMPTPPRPASNDPEHSSRRQ